MSLSLRILLIVCALIALFFVAKRVKKRKILMEDAIFWVVLSVVFVIVAIVPEIAFICSDFLGFVSPSNFIFLIIIALLLMKVFTCTSEISLLKYRVNELAQEIALRDKEDEE